MERILQTSFPKFQIEEEMLILQKRNFILIFHNYGSVFRIIYDVYKCIHCSITFKSTETFVKKSIYVSYVLTW